MKIKTLPMKKVNPFPNLGLGFQRMKVQDKLMDVSTESIIGYAIHEALNNKKPLNDIMKMVMEQYYDSPNTLLDVVPQETIDLIKSIYY